MHEKLRPIIVEDEYINRVSLARYVHWETLGYAEPLLAATGEEALAHIGTGAVDVALVDIHLPTIDGLELIRRMTDALPHVQVIITSAHDEFRYAQAAITMGVRGYLLKPIKIEEIEALLGQIAAEIDDRETEDAAEAERIAAEYHNPVIRIAVRHLVEHSGEDISVNELARTLHFSTSHLSALFKRETGQSITAFLTRLRIERAKALLVNPLLRVQEIGEMVGYPTSSYFISQFRKATGMTPVEYRNNITTGG